MPAIPTRIVEMNGTVVVGEDDIERAKTFGKCLGVWRSERCGACTGLNDGLAASRSDVRNEWVGRLGLTEAR